MKNNLKRVRLAAGMPQKELARRVGVARETIIRIEGDKMNPSLLLAYRIAAALQCHVEEIFVPEENMLLQ